LIADTGEDQNDRAAIADKYRQRFIITVLPRETDPAGKKNRRNRPMVAIIQDSRSRSERNEKRLILA
jgi:hypothetical protein